MEPNQRGATVFVDFAIVAIVCVVAGVLVRGHLAEKERFRHEGLSARQQIAIAAGESIDEMVANLADFKMYYEPRNGKNSLKDLRGCLELMLGNRRCLRLLNELQRPPRDEATRLCQQIFDGAIETHVETQERCFRMYEDPSAPREPQNLTGTQEAICAAMFYTALLTNARVLLNQFDALDAMQSRIDARLERFEPFAVEGRDIDELARDMQRLATRMCLPDNRFQLNVLLLAAGADRRKELLARFPDVKERTIRIPPWHAPFRPFDFTRYIEEGPANPPGVDDTGTWELSVYTSHAPDFQPRENQHAMIAAIREFLAERRSGEN